MKMKEKKVAVHGSYFADNYGDTLLVKLVCDIAAEHVGRENVYLAVPGNRKEQQAIGYPVVSAEERSSITHLLYGGGGYLGERTSKFFENAYWSLRNYRRHLSWLSSFPNARTAVIGAGFGPISNQMLRSKVGKLLKSSDVVLLRDQESVAFAQGYGISNPSLGMCVDVALSLAIKDEPRSGIAVHADNLEPGELEVLFSSVIAALGQSTSVDVIFDNPPSYSDSVAAKYQESAKRCGLTNELKFRPYDRFDLMVDRVASYSMIITSKLHVGITCIAQGGIAISIPTHQKTVRLYRQLGISHFCIPRSELSRERLTSVLGDTATFVPDREVIDRGITKVRDAIETFLK